MKKKYESFLVRLPKTFIEQTELNDLPKEQKGTYACLIIRRGPFSEHVARLNQKKKYVSQFGCIGLMVR